MLDEEIRVYPLNTDYKVSSYGYVIGKKGKIMHGSKSYKGYLRINTVESNGKLTARYIHRMVMETFYPKDINEAQLLDVNHKDGDVTNNNIENLEWCTHKQNCQHRNEVLHHDAHPTRNIYAKNLITGEIQYFRNQEEGERYYKSRGKGVDIGWYLYRAIRPIWKKENIEFGYTDEQIIE